VRLAHIRDAADELGDYMRGVGLDDYFGDRMRQRAVERLLTIVGEAAKTLSDDARNAIDQPWREIIRFRDKGIHGYDGLDPRSVYRIATESIPALREAVEVHLAGRADG
jgi:uncharacterized protein with HEPN domain